MQAIPQSISSDLEQGGLDLKKESKAKQALQNDHVKRIFSNHSQKNPCLDLANQSIKIIPTDVFVFSKLQQLYLEGNQISELQREFFHHLPSLTWLDLRNNCLKSLPSTIGHHKCLKQLLLEGNELAELPVELGQVHTLTALSLHRNPLSFPPKEVITQGVKAVKGFLWEEYCQSYGFEASEGATSRTLSHIIDEVEEYNKTPDKKPAVAKSQPLTEFALSKPAPILPRDPPKQRRSSSTTEQFMEQFRKRVEAMKKKESAWKPKARKTKRQSSADARLSGSGGDGAKSNLKFSAQRETFAVERAIATTDTTAITSENLNNNNHDMMETDTSSQQIFNDVIMDKQDERIEMETRQAPVRSTKEEDIRARMRLHSRRMNRKNNQEKSVNEKVEEIPPEYEETNDQYRFRAFTGDLIPDTPPTTNHYNL